MYQHRIREKIIKAEPFIYENYNLTKDDLPIFVLSLLDDPWIPLADKEEFLSQVAIPYLTDKKFRKENTNKVIMIEKNRFIGISHKESMHNYGDPKIVKTTINIGELPTVNCFGSIIIPKNEREYVTEKGISKIKSEHYKVTVNFTHLKKIEKGNYCSSEMIFDTGNEITICPSIKWWNFGIKDFDCPEFDTFSNDSNENILENSDILLEWSSKIESKTKITMAQPSVSSDVLLVELNPPMYLSIDNLKPVKLTKFLVGISENDSLMPLLGLDIINQYTSTISNFNGNVELRIQNQREEM